MRRSHPEWHCQNPSFHVLYSQQGNNHKEAKKWLFISLLTIILQRIPQRNHSQNSIQHNMDVLSITVGFCILDRFTIWKSCQITRREFFLLFFSFERDREKKEWE